MPNFQPIAAIEAEQSVLGSILIKPAYLQEIIEIIRPEDFSQYKNQIIYQAMIDLHSEEVAIDLTTIVNNLREKNILEKAGGAIYLISLSDNVGVAANIKHYAQIIYDKSTLRRLRDIALNIQKDCENSNRDKVGEVLDRAKNWVQEIIEGSHIKGGKNISKRIREYAEVTDGNIEVTQMYKNLGLVTGGNKKAALMALKRMVGEGTLTKIKPGYYRKIEEEAPRITLKEAKNYGSEWEICYPFGLEKWFITYPKTVVVVSGNPDAGKTAFLLNLARLNMRQHAPIYYWTSEMGGRELVSRVENFDDYIEEEWDQWVQFHERDDNFGDVVMPDAINLIDYLELTDEHWKVAGKIKDIWNRLDKGIAIIGLQKDPSKPWGKGGIASAEKARLYLNLESKKGGWGNIMEVVKIKNWRDKMTNLKGKTYEYKLVKGCKFLEID